MIGINAPSYMAALESQLAALQIVEQLIACKNKDVLNLKPAWNVDKYLLTRAAPFSWSAETTDAVLAASRSIPADTMMNRWNLSTETVWWYFDKLLPFRTTHKDMGVRALSFGFVPTRDAHRFGLPICVWTDDLKDEYPVAPSQTFEWSKETTLQAMLDETRLAHRQIYGPGGRWEHTNPVGEEVFMDAADGVARFILAGLAWLNQKVLVTADGHIERHRRKDFARRIKPIEGVRVVQLRRNEYPKREGESSDEHREYSCRFGVDGHWRNQPYGPKSGDRRLTYILPFVKGPADKPFKIPARKVFVVNR